MSNIVVTITGPSAGGKSTMEKQLVARGFARLTSHTTRQPRDGEIDGKDYHFISNAIFAEMLRSGQMVESVEFGGNFYGVSALEFEKEFAKGRPVVVVVEPSGARQIKEYAKKRDWQVFSVYVEHRPEVLVERFINRDSSASPAAVAKRISHLFQHELAWAAIPGWDMKVHEFSKENEVTVVNTICGIVDSL